MCKRVPQTRQYWYEKKTALTSKNVTRALRQAERKTTTLFRLVSSFFFWKPDWGGWTSPWSAQMARLIGAKLDHRPGPRPRSGNERRSRRSPNRKPNARRPANGRRAQSLKIIAITPFAYHVCRRRIEFRSRIDRAARCDATSKNRSRSSFSNPKCRARY